MVPKTLHENVRRSALFDELDQAAMTAILNAATVQETPAGSALFHQGDAPTHVLQIASGLIKMSQVNADGARTTLGILGAGELVGCVAAFKQIPFPATAMALSPSITVGWKLAVFQDLSARIPGLATNALLLLADRTRDMVSRVSGIMNRSVEQRVAGTLLRLAERVGETVADGIQVGLPITRVDIAELAGVTHFTVSRTLSNWQKDGLVRSGRQRITVLSPQRLARIAADGEGAA